MTAALTGAAWRPVRGSVPLLVVVGLLLVAAPAASQEEGDEPVSEGDVHLRITHLTGTLGPGSAPTDDSGATQAGPDRLAVRTLVENRGSQSLDALRVVVEVHPAVVTPGLLREALDGDVVSDPLYVHDRPLADGSVEAGGIVGSQLGFDARDVDWAGGAGGVHPVRIAVVRGTQVLDELVTAVVWLSRLPDEPLLTTVVWPLETTPWRSTGGAFPANVDRELRPGGRLDVLLAALEQEIAPPVVLAPDAHLLEDLADRADGYVRQERQDDGALETRRIDGDAPGAARAASALARLRELTGRLPLAPVSSTYADADLAALLDGGGELAELAAEAAVEGRRRLQLQLDVGIDATTHLISDHVDEAVLDLLPADTLLVPSRITDRPPLGNDPELGRSVRHVRTPAGRRITLLLGSPYVTEALGRLSDESGGVVGAQRVLAHTALAYLRAPSTAGRSLLALPPRGFAPGPAAVGRLLDGLTAATWLRPGPPARLATSARASTTPVGLVPGADPAFPPAFADALRAAASDLDAVRRAVPAGTATLEERTLDDLRDDLLQASSRWYRGDASAAAEALVRDVQRRLDAVLGDVALGAGSVTLTSDSGQIPVTVQRTSGGPLEVRVEIESQGRLLWPAGRVTEEVVLTEGDSQTVTFETRALSTGTFPVTVRATDATGTRELGRTSLTVRSTAISGPALGGIAALVVVLLLIGALRRRDRRPGLRVVDGRPPDDTPPPGA